MESQFNILSSDNLSFHIVKDDEPYLKESDFFENEKLKLEVNGNVNIAFTDKRIVFFENKDKETVRLTLAYHSINRWITVTNDIPKGINTPELSITIYTERNTYELLTFDKYLLEQIDNCLMRYVL